MLWFEPEMSPTGLYFKRSLVSSTIFKAVEPLGSWTWLEEIGTAVIFFWICHRVRVFTTLSCCENPTMPSPPGGPCPLTQSAQMNPPLSCSSQVFGSWRWSKQLIQCSRNSVGVGQLRGSEALRTMLCREQAGTEHRGITWSHNEERGDAKCMPNDSIS